MILPTRKSLTTPRVAHVVISLANGGLERLVVRWTRERNLRFPGSTLVYCLDELGELSSELPEGVVRCIGARRAWFPWDWRAVRRLHEMLVSDAVQVVHSHNMPAQQYTALATAKTPVAHVYTQHGPGRHNFRFRNSMRSKILAHVTDRIVAVSHDTRQCMHDRYGVGLERIEVVPNGIDPQPEYECAELARLRAELGLSADDFVLGSLGRLASIKAWDRFLPVFNHLSSLISANNASTLKLLLVGDGPERAGLERQVGELGLSGRVVFAGFQVEARKYLELMDVFLLPSYAEGLSVALLEALAAGVPAVCTDVGDSRRVLEGAGVGLVLPESVDGWPGLIAEFLASPGALERAGRVGREFVLEHYTAGATRAAYEAIYASLLVKFEASRRSYQAVLGDAGRAAAMSFGGAGHERSWRHPNLITQLRYHGVTAKLVPRWLRGLVHRFLPETHRDSSIWLASYQNVLRHARPATEMRSGVKLGIVKDVMLRHSYYEAACLELGVAYEVVDITAPDWMVQVQGAGCDAFVVRPFVLHSVGRALYEERVRFMVRDMGCRVYPKVDELWYYESKRRVATWLELNGVAHPSTWVFCSKAEALGFVAQASYPLMFKTDLGSEALGVTLVRTPRMARRIVRDCFGRGYNQSRRDSRDRQWGFVIFQEYVPGAKEWRVVRIGNSFFGHQKGRDGEFHSGTKLKIYEAPPRELLEFVRGVTDRGGFECMAVDILEDQAGNYLVNEMQAYFGSIHPYLMLVEGEKGRYLYDEASGQYNFEEGDFTRNNCCNLRVQLLLEQLRE